MPVVCNIYKVCLYRVCTMGKKLCLEKLLFEKMKINLFKKSCEIKCLRNVLDNRSATPRGDRSSLLQLLATNHKDIIS